MMERLERVFENRLERGIELSRLGTRERILEAAISLFGEKGYTATSTREIAERAQVNTITLFRHFNSKENLFREAVLVRLSTGNVLEPAQWIQLSTGDLRNDLKQLATKYLQIMKSRIDSIWISLIESRQNPEVSRLIMQVTSKLEHHLTEYLEDLHGKGRIPKTNFQLFASMFYGTLFQYVIYSCLPAVNESKHMDEEELVNMCVDLYSLGLTHLDSLKGNDC